MLSVTFEPSGATKRFSVSWLDQRRACRSLDLDKPVKAETGGVLGHDGIHALQECDVTAERVVLPQMLRHPYPARGEQAPARRLSRRGEAPGL